MKVLVFVSLFYFGAARKLPSTFEICSRNDPKLDECLAKAIEHALPYLKEDRPKLGIFSLDPILIQNLKFGRGATGVVSLDQRLTDFKIFNLLQTKINKTQVHLGKDEFKLNLQIYNKRIKFETDYEIEGKILLLPIAGKGQAHFHFDDVDANVTVTGGFRDKNGVRFLEMGEVGVRLEPGLVEGTIDNLFDGEPRLGDEMNKLLNEHWRELFEDLREQWEGAFSTYFKSAFQAVFDRVPYDELFPVGADE